MNYNFTELNENIGGYTEYIREYLDFLVEGDDKKAHCPFTSKMLHKKLFYYDVSDKLLSYDEFHEAISQLSSFILDKDDRLAVAGIVYANKVNYSSEAAIQIEEFRQKIRIDLISNSLTTAWTHPQNPVGTHTDKEKPNYPLWVSKVPLLMVRYLDKGDEPFMLTEDVKTAFVKGMNYEDKVQFLHGKGTEIPIHHRINILVELMGYTRISSIKSIQVYSGGSFGFMVNSYITKDDKKHFPRSGPPLF